MIFCLQTYKDGNNRIYCSFLNISFPIPEHQYSIAIIISTIRWNMKFDEKCDISRSSKSNQVSQKMVITLQVLSIKPCGLNIILILGKNIRMLSKILGKETLFKRKMQKMLYF